MLNNLEELKKRIDIINNLLPTFDTEERKEIKKNNKLIDELVNEMNAYKDLLLKVIVNKKEKSLPKEDGKKIKDNLSDISSLMDNINLLSNMGYLAKLELDKNIYDIENSSNFDNINDVIKIVIDKFKLINVNLNADDFKYSVTLYKYMVSYFDNISNLEFDVIMKEFFDSLYWENPNLIYHLSLCLKELVLRYKKQFESYINNLNCDKVLEDEINKYNDLKNKTDVLVSTNKYINYNLFINKELNIDDYLISSSVFKDNINKFMDYDKFISFSKDDKMLFYKEIRGLYYSLNEFIYLKDFDFLIKNVKDIYANKDSYKNNFGELDKMLKKLDSIKDKMVKKLFNLYFKLQKNSKNNRLNNKYNDLFNKVNVKIDEIINTYKEYDKSLFINDVITKLNDNSTYYDMLELYKNNYSYLMSLLKDNNKDNSFYNEYIDYLTNSNLVISKSLVFINDIDIKEKLIDKYELFNINFDLDDGNINALKETLNYLYRFSYYDEYELDLNLIKLIVEIDKLKKI